MFYLLIVLLPLVGALISGFFGFFIGRHGSAIISTISVAISFILSCLAFYEVGILGHVSHVTLFSWVQTGYLEVNWGFLFDQVTVVMLIVVTSVSTLVHCYGYSYMGEDPHLSRFMSYLSFFTFFMLILVTGDNFMQLFTGWEGVGVSSYLLINFWFTRIQAGKSAIKAMVVNRIGDFGLALGIALIFYTFGTFNYTQVFAMAPSITTTSLTFNFLGLEFSQLDLIGILLFIGSMGKSAQIGLHTWLPDAMEGPTPVSALIHAATMVTAGVFLVVRCSPLFEYMSAYALLFITVVGSLTAFFAATTGLVQNDMKRVIAYSTCSQLGYMIFACGLSNYSAAMFHLTNHAFFKALLFLGAGAVIHSIAGEQDLRKMGGLARSTPFVYTAMLLGSLALMGFPYLSGFYSKDIILETSFATLYVDASVSYILGSLGAFCTAFYSARLAYHTFVAKPMGFKHYFSHFHATSGIMLFVLATLSIGSVFSGYLLKDMFVGPGTDFWGNAIFFSLNARPVLVTYEYIPVFFKLLPLLFGLTASTGAFILYHYAIKLYLDGKSDFFINIGVMPGFMRDVFNFLGEKWYFDKIYKKFVGDDFLFYGYYVTLNTLDRGIIEVVGPYGVSYQVNNFVRNFNINAFPMGNLQSYIYPQIFVFGLGCLVLADLVPEVVLNMFGIFSEDSSLHIYVTLFLWFFIVIYTQRVLKKSSVQ